MQFIFTIGTLPVAAALLIARRGKLEKSGKGISYAVLNGVLAGVGGLTLFAAYHTNSNTSVITTATALYPMITVVLAVLILRERLTLVQMVGLVFAALAIVAFSV
jgi:transporter family protein